MFLASYCGLGWLGLSVTMPLAKRTAPNSTVAAPVQVCAGPGALCRDPPGITAECAAVNSTILRIGCTSHA